MATKRLKKGESPAKMVAAIESRIKTWRTRLNRASNTLAKLEKQRSYYVKKMVETGV